MAEKFKKRLSRRAQERLSHALRAFDLTMLGILLVAALCFAISYFRGADLKAHASSGFAYWFLVVIGYPPMLFVNAVRATCGMAIPAPGPHGELFLVSVRSGALPRREGSGLDYRVVSQSASGAVYELCGTGEDLGRFCSMVPGAKFDIARTGITAVEK